MMESGKVYLTIKTGHRVHDRITIEDLYSKELDELGDPKKWDFTSTTTLKLDYQDINEHKFGITEYIIDELLVAKRTYINPDGIDVDDEWNVYSIPKRNGGTRTIYEPVGDTRNYLNYLTRRMTVMSKMYNGYQGAPYNTHAFAYVEHRKPLDAIRKHKINESNWFVKFDFKDFFGSFTEDAVLEQLNKLAIFHRVFIADRDERMRKILSPAFYQGKLPQGSPLSPMLSNLIMIPFDYELSHALQDKHQDFVYTRYADDILISSKQQINVNDIRELIMTVIKELNLPLKINDTKTKYMSVNGANWNLGLMFNQEHEITIGYRAKKKFKAALTTLAMDKKNMESDEFKINWDSERRNKLLGISSYYSSIEKEFVDETIKKYNEKFGVDLLKILRRG